MNLSNKSLEKVVNEVNDFFKEAEVSSKDQRKINLVTEEILLRLRENFGTEKEFTLTTRKWFGSPKVIIRMKGKPFNPLETYDDDIVLSSEIMKNLLSYETAGTSYEYKSGYNEVTIFSTKEKKLLKIPGGAITVSVLLAIIFSMLVKFLPTFLQDFILNSLANPLLDSLMGLIIAVTIPTIFISIVASICIMDDVATLSNIGLKVLKSSMIMMTILAVMNIVGHEILLSVVRLEVDMNILTGQIIDLFLSMFPSSIIQPFIDVNILQIVVIAFAVGICVVILDKRVANTKIIIAEIKVLLFKITDLTMKVIPFLIFLTIFKTIMTISLDSLSVAWKIIALRYFICFTFASGFMMYLKNKYNINIKDFCKKCSPTLSIAFATGSSTAAMLPNFDVCKKNLKLNSNFCDFMIPMSITLNCPSEILCFTSCAFVGAYMSEATLSITQILLIVFLSLQLSIATPKVGGGTIAGYTILLNQFGFTMDAIGVAIIVDVFTDHATTVFAMLMRNADIYDLSHKVKVS